MWKLVPLGKISIFKTLAFSRTIQLTLVTSVFSSNIDLIRNIQKNFLWDMQKLQKLNMQPYVVIMPLVV